jgi:hypothetical protein
MGAPSSPAEVPLPKEADVRIIGAKLTGPSAARHWRKQENPSLCLI